MRGGTLYLSENVPPCPGCQRLIDGMGLKVVYFDDISASQLVRILHTTLKERLS